jgi:hypothetical protein
MVPHPRPRRGFARPRGRLLPRGCEPRVTCPPLAVVRPATPARAYWFAGGALVLVFVLTLVFVAPFLWDPIRVRTLDVPDHAAFTAFLRTDDQRAEYARFVAFLASRRVDRVVPAWQLWRQGDAWRGLGTPAFAIPPRGHWDRVVPTLALVRDEIVPAVGPVDVVSGFRSDDYNRHAGGANESRHLDFEAVDLVPRRWWTRWGLRNRLSEVWRDRGRQNRMGLGLYGGTRFHVDTHRFRAW